jgi:hypothetical protein
VRGQIIDLLEGRIRRVDIISSVAEMWDDPDRYISVETAKKNR